MTKAKINVVPPRLAVDLLPLDLPTAKPSRNNLYGVQKILFSIYYNDQFFGQLSTDKQGRANLIKMIDCQ